ncbi:MAG TPA: alpha/beta hydrolase [Actinospica sp.]|jgi:pimeloyl-ACP methyl ester carboxylesterase|nr:alpha/beta hydrolase [Actinospica sp.]
MMISRRTLGKAVGAGIGAAALPATTTGIASAADTGSVPVRSASSSSSSFTEIKQVDAGLLNVGYAEVGPAHGPVVICLHGWPYDIHSYTEAASLLAAEGYRVIVPYLRGYGTTTFLSADTVRTAQQTAFALDLIALMDTLRIEKAVLAGFDWGSRTADCVAALWPHRVKALVSTSGYLITNLEAQKTPLPPKSEYAWWYQYYFATERGELAMNNQQDRHDLAKLVWSVVSPNWNFTDATFEQTAAAFENPDYPAIVIDNYCWRLSLAPSRPQYARYEDVLQTKPTISVPTVTLDPALDPFTAPGDGSTYRAMFTGPYQHHTLQNVGHNVPQEAPAAFAAAVLEADRL